LALATHLAETEAELELLSTRQGPFVSFLTELNVWDPDGLARSAKQVLDLCAPAPRLLLAHGNYLDPTRTLPPQSTVVYCPRTHAAFGHEPYPLHRLLQAGVRVALGTDSLASNPDLSVLEEARFVHRLHPAIAPETVLRIATLHGAEALGWAHEVGSL